MNILLKKNQILQSIGDFLKTPAAYLYSSFVVFYKNLYSIELIGLTHKMQSEGSIKCIHLNVPLNYVFFLLLHLENLSPSFLHL